MIKVISPLGNYPIEFNTNVHLKYWTQMLIESLYVSQKLETGQSSIKKWISLINSGITIQWKTSYQLKC